MQNNRKKGKWVGSSSILWFSPQIGAIAGHGQHQARKQEFYPGSSVPVSLSIAFLGTLAGTWVTIE